MARRDAAPLPERTEVVERHLVAGQVQERVEQHAGVPGAQHEAVSIRPVGVGRGVAEEARPQHVGHRCGAHRGAGMPGVRLLDGVDRERPDRVDREPVEIGGDAHRAGLPAARRDDARGGPAIVAAAPLSSGHAVCAAPRATASTGTPRPPATERRSSGRRPDPDRGAGRPRSRRRPGTGVPARLGHGRAGQGQPRPGRLRGHDRALARPAGCPLEPHRVGRTRSRRPGAGRGHPWRRRDPARVARGRGTDRADRRPRRPRR